MEQLILALGPLAESADIPLSYILEQLTNKSYQNLINLCDSLPNLSIVDRKSSILEYSVANRELFVKLLVLVRWAKNSKEISNIQNLLAWVTKLDNCFALASDMLYGIHRDLKAAREPIYDVSTAIDVLTTGKYQRLPSIIKETLVGKEPPTELEIQLNLAKIDDILRTRLICDEVVPMELKKGMHVGNGAVAFTVENEFKVTLTVSDSGQSDQWRIKDLKILVKSERDGYENVSYDLKDHQILNVMRIAQKRILLLEPKEKEGVVEHLEFYPLIELYKYLHYFCYSLQLEILNSQSTHLLKTRWSNLLHVKFDRLQGILKIQYWCNSTNENAFQKHFLEIAVSESKASPRPSSIGKTIEERKKIEILRSFSNQVDRKRILSIKGYSLHFFANNTLEKEVDLHINDQTQLSLIGSQLDIELILFRTARLKSKDIISELFNALLPHSNQSLSTDHSGLPKVGQFTSSEVEISNFNNPYELLIEGGNSEKIEMDLCVMIKYHPNRTARCSVDLRTGNIVIVDAKSIVDDYDRFGQVSEMINKSVASASDAFLYLRSQTVVERIKALANYLNFTCLNHTPVKGILITNPGHSDLDTLPEKALSNHTLFLRFPEFSHWFIVVSIEGSSSDIRTAVGQGVKEVDVPEGVLFRCWIVQIASSSSDANSEVEKSILVGPDDGGTGLLGRKRVWEKFDLVTLKRLDRIGRIQIAYSKILSQIQAHGLNYGNTLKRNLGIAQTLNRISEGIDIISIDNNKFSLKSRVWVSTEENPSSSKNLLMDEEYSIENLQNIFGNEQFCEIGATGSDKMGNATGLPFGSLYCFVEDYGVKKAIYFRSRLDVNSLPPITIEDGCNNESMFVFDKVKSSLTLKLHDIKGLIGICLFHWVELTMILQLAKQVQKREQYLNEKHIKIISFDLKRLVIELTSKNAVDILTFYWKSKISTFHGTFPKIHGKFCVEYTNSTGDLESINSIFYKSLLEFIDIELNKDLNLFSICEILGKINRLTSLVLPFLISLKPISITHHRILVLDHGIDILIHKNGLYSIIDSANPLHDTYNFLNSFPQQQRETRPFPLLSYDAIDPIPNKLSLFTTLSVFLDRGEVSGFITPIPTGVVFSALVYEKVFECILASFVIVEDLRWFYDYIEGKVLQRNDIDESELSISFVLLNYTVNLKFDLEKNVDIKFDPTADALLEVSMEKFNMLSTSLSSKLSNLNFKEATVRQKLEFIINFSLLPFPLVKNFVDENTSSEGNSVELCIRAVSSGSNNMAYLPTEGEFGVLIDRADNRISVTIRTSTLKSDGTTKVSVIGFRYNYVSGVIGMWKAHADDEPVSTLTLDADEISTQLDIANSVWQDKYDGTFLKLVKMEVTAAQGGPGKLFFVLKSFAKMAWRNRD